MARLDEPDLRSLAVALLEEGHKLWPEVVLVSDAKRVVDCTNVLLVCSRIALNVAKRAGMTKEVTARVVERSKWVPDPVDMAIEYEDPQVVDGTDSIHDVMWACDQVLHHPATRCKLPDWFVQHYWPALCKRVAGQGRVTDRDKEVVMYWTSMARGER